MMITSILHQRSPTPVKGSQVRLLLDTQCQLLDLLLQDSRSSISNHTR